MAKQQGVNKSAEVRAILNKSPPGMRGLSIAPLAPPAWVMQGEPAIYYHLPCFPRELAPAGPASSPDCRIPSSISAYTVVSRISRVEPDDGAASTSALSRAAGESASKLLGLPCSRLSTVHDLALFEWL